MAKIYHCPGDIKNNYIITNNLYNTYKNQKLNKPNDLTIIIIYNKDNETPLINQLKYNNIDYINAYYPVNNTEWKNSLKIKYIQEAIINVKTKYTIVLDATDVVIESLDNIIEDFEKMNVEIVFNASPKEFPKGKILDIIENRKELGKYCQFNSGAFIGYTEAIYKLYKDLDYTKSNSDQEIIRSVLNNYITTFKDNQFINIDSNKIIFNIVKHKK